eukprot:GFKZ01005253.1.p1 GENE.GFKZ01005253.1~~GFKZ01005253.1.p1  ORF type:complete len:421 (-),score=61.23 GFKZ01005253.1:962-2224(-)
MKSARSKTSVSLPILSLLLLFLLSHPVPSFAAESVDEQLQSLSSAELAKLEKNLRKQVDEHDAELTAMRKDTERLKAEQKLIDEEAERLQGAKKWEMEEKISREKELEAAKEDVLLKQESILKMTAMVGELKDQIERLEKRLADLNREKDSTERRYQDPSLVDVLDSRAQNWGTVTRNVYNKTMTNVVPVLSDMTETARSYRRNISRTSRALEFLVSFLIYTFVIVSCMVVYRIYNRVRGKLTISRLLFLGDSFCACFWAIMLIGFCVLFDDPLFVMKANAPTPFFLFQLVACMSYVNFVLLRVLVLASKMTLGALGETLAVVVVGHHYYVRVWQPAMLDKPFRGTFFYYFCYAWLFSAFAYNRIQEFAPLKQLRGPKLPPLMWLRVLFARFTAKGVPDGDIESSPFLGADDDDDEGHER